MKNYSKQILEIHNEFETAAEKLLEETKLILESVKEKPIEKAERLKKVGFTQSKEVIELTQLSNDLKQRETQLSLIQYYQKNYPNNKFITEQQVEKICKKYNLVAATLDRYKGFVPENKLSEIEKFSVNIYDFPEEKAINVVFRYPSIDSSKILQLKKKYKGIYPKPDIYDLIENVSVNSYELIENSKLLICAPKKDMDLKGLKK